MTWYRYVVKVFQVRKKIRSTLEILLLIAKSAAIECEREDHLGCAGLQAHNENRNSEYETEQTHFLTPLLCTGVHLHFHFIYLRKTNLVVED